MKFDMKEWCLNIDRVVSNDNLDPNIEEKANNLLTEFMQLITNNVDGNTLVHYFCFHGCANALNFLIKNHSVMINSRNAHGLTPITLAVKNNHQYVVQLLIEAGVSCKNKYYRFRQGPLYQAIDLGLVDMVNLIIGSNIRINDVDYKGRTALMFLFTGYERRVYLPEEVVNKIMDTLLKANCDVNKIDLSNCTALRYAYRNHYYYVIKKLLENKADPDIFDLMIDIVMSKDCETLKLLFNYGATVNLCDSEHRSILHLACRQVNFEMVKILIDKGAKSYYSDKYGTFPIHALLINDYNKSVPDPEKYRSDFREILVYLLNHGSPLNSIFRELSPLYVLLRRYDCPDIVQILLDYGAVFDYTDLTLKSLLCGNKDLTAPGMQPITSSILTLLRYTVKCIAQNLTYKVLNFDVNLLTEDLRNYYDKCLHEINVMKSRRIKCNNYDDQNDSLFKLFLGNYVVVHHMVKEIEKLENAKFDFSTEFPIYGDILNKNLSELYKKYSIFPLAEKGLSKLIGLDTSDYPFIMGNILEDLETSALHNLADINSNKIKWYSF